jgi:hypothetical protein
MFGEKKFRNIKIIIIKRIERRSFHEKKLWNVNLSRLELQLDGLLDPNSWRKIKWNKIIEIIINGKRKWNVKNRVNVGLLIENPPHNQITNSFPIRGKADNRLVITVAPQKDICPHGRTYPKKEVIIKRSNNKTPEFQVILFLKDLFRMFREMWI